jgi:hypothetical protein
MPTASAADSASRTTAAAESRSRIPHAGLPAPAVVLAGRGILRDDSGGSAADRNETVYPALRCLVQTTGDAAHASAEITDIAKARRHKHQRGDAT